MAESSIPGAGYGVFTTRRIPENSYLFPPDGPAISIPDVEFHYGREPDWPVVDYVWSGEGYTTFESDVTAEFVVNTDCLVNYHTYLNNVDHWADEYDDSLLSRFEDPGAGAFSYYKGHTLVATRGIEAGEEIFANYGENWLDTREKYDFISRKADYLKAGRFVRRVYDEWKKGQIEGVDCEYVQQYVCVLFLPWSILLTCCVLTDDVIGMLHDIYDMTIVQFTDKRVASILPKNREEFESLFAFLNETDIQQAQHIPQSLIDQTLAFSTTNKRNVTWIEENGMCLDNLISKTSTLAQAGYGAFSQRYIPKGDMIVPAPLLMLADRSALNMYNLTRNEKGELTPTNDKVVGKQLLLNYCFSHSESSIVLCPNTNAVVMNHCSNRMEWGGSCGSTGPNAEVRWGYSWDSTTKPWLNSTREQLSERLKKGERGLSFEVIALRDIDPDEEVFIDYGVEWENAFLEHSANWKPPKEGSGFENYVPIQKLNEEKGSFRTLSEQKQNPYPDNARTVCYKLYDINDDEVELDDDDLFWYRDEVSDEEAAGVGYFGYRNTDEIDDIDASFPNQVVTSGKLHIDDKKSHSGGCFWPCQILSKEKDGYIVRILHKHGYEDMRWVAKRQARVLTSFPEQSIKFATESYKSDQFLPGAFRHHIGLRDNMFPEHWKDLAPK